MCASGAILGFICFLTPDESCSSDQPPDMTMAMGGQARGGALCSTFFHPQLPTEVAAQQISCPRRPIRAGRRAASTFSTRAKLISTWCRHGASEPCIVELARSKKGPQLNNMVTKWLVESEGMSRRTKRYRGVEVPTTYHHPNIRKTSNCKGIK